MDNTIVIPALCFCAIYEFPGTIGVKMCPKKEN